LGSPTPIFTADSLRLTRLGCHTIAGVAEQLLTERPPTPALVFEPQPQELVMTLLGGYLQARDRRVSSSGLVSLLAEFGFSAGAARVALARLVRRGLIARVRRGRLVDYTLTARSRAVLDEGDRRIFSLGRGGGAGEQWTVLWHTIPEDRRLERQRLVRRLRFLGFGQVHDGAWIAPHDRERAVAALLAELDIGRYAGLMLARPATMVDVRAFVARVWDLDELDARYRAFLHDFGGCRPASLDDREAFVARTRLVHTFRQFAVLDPELPEDLVPAPEHRSRAVRLFHDLYPALAPAAQRHFDEVTEP
jgi:phenylacetic acid degradation operon negative regulatory protein